MLRQNLSELQIDPDWVISQPKTGFFLLFFYLFTIYLFVFISFILFTELINTYRLVYLNCQKVQIVNLYILHALDIKEKKSSFGLLIVFFGNYRAPIEVVVLFIFNKLLIRIIPKFF
jgi:hypothetical protein